MPVDEFIMPDIAAVSTCYNAGAELEKAFAGLISGLSNQGPVVPTLFLLLAISVMLNLMQQRNANKMLTRLFSLSLSGKNEEDKDVDS